MTREQEFRKQTEEAKFEAFSVMCEKVNELEKENAELKKEVLEVRQHLELTEEEWAKDTSKMICYKTQLIKAKAIIKKLVEGIRITYEHKGFITDVDVFLEKAEQFLKEVEE
jgi:molecular chaperone GrpE (heat shock protein)